MAKHVFDPNLPHLGGNIEGGDPYTFYPELWKWFVDELGVKTVFDVGCGTGEAIDEFARLGCEAGGIDGLWTNVEKCKQHFEIEVHDLTTGSYLIGPPVDLVWCCEVVEHVEEKYIDYLMETLCQGIYVAITHALPRQRGVHHVNCQPPGYWIDQFVKRGYKLDLTLTTLSMQHVPNPDHHWRRSGMIFVRA